MSENKIEMLVFVPLSACSCNYSAFMDRVFNAILPYRDHISMQTMDAQGEEAVKYKISQNSVVIVNPPNQKEPLTFTNSIRLKDFFHANIYSE